MPRADRDGVDLVGGEHQRRQVEAAAQHIADADGAVDWHAARLQRGDIAVDRANGDFELLGERRRGQRLRCRPEGLDDVEETVGAAHRRASFLLTERCQCADVILQSIPAEM
jgi:hypothetical protein